MYTIEFDNKGWAVYNNVGANIFRMTQPLPGDTGKATCTKLAAELNAKTKG